MTATDPTVADLVHQYRVEHNWSRERLAREMHKSISWLAQVERGELGLTDVTVLDRFATLLGAPLAEFIDATLGPSTERPRQRPHVEQLRLALAGHPVPDTNHRERKHPYPLRPQHLATTPRPRLAPTARKVLPRARPCSRLAAGRP